MDCPYLILGLSKYKRYKREDIDKQFMKKRKILHPSITNGNTTFEYYTLKKAYKTLLKNFEKDKPLVQDTYEIRNSIERPLETSLKKNNVLANEPFDTIQFPELKSKVECNNVEYNSKLDTIIHKRIIDPINFNNENFNHIYEYLKEGDNEVGNNEVGNNDSNILNVEPYQDNKFNKYSKIHTFNGLMMDAPEIEDDIEPYHSRDSEKILNKLHNINNEDIDKIVKMKKGTNVKEISKKLVLHNRDNIISSLEKISFSEIPSYMDKKLVDRLKDEMDCDRKIIMDNAHLFNSEDVKMALQGNVKDSSNFINEDGTIGIPSGLRKCE